uniref:Uncharacterized protein n=1 Tax=Aegilops tauschii TaxID=37682 RepID=M8AN41_AEGTA
MVEVVLLVVEVPLLVRLLRVRRRPAVKHPNLAVVGCCVEGEGATTPPAIPATKYKQAHLGPGRGGDQDHSTSYHPSLQVQAGPGRGDGWMVHRDITITYVLLDSAKTWALLGRPPRPRWAPRAGRPE